MRHRINLSNVQRYQLYWGTSPERLARQWSDGGDYRRGADSARNAYAEDLWQEAADFLGDMRLAYAEAADRETGWRP